MSAQQKGGAWLELKEQRFGIEIEMTGITRAEAAMVTAAYFGTESSYIGTYYENYAALDGQGRQWKSMSDSSIEPERKSGNRRVWVDSDYSTEMVSPICRYEDEDIKAIEEIIRELKNTGQSPTSPAASMCMWTRPPLMPGRCATSRTSWHPRRI